MADYTFRVDLRHDGNTLQSPSEVLAAANTKTIYLPLHTGGLPIRKFKHGDTFVLSGMIGRNLKKLIEQERIFNVVLVESEEVVLNNQLFCCRSDGIYSMLLDDSFLSIGGRVYKWSEEFLPEGGFETVNDIAMASDGQYNYVMINTDSAQYTLMKIDSDGETVLITVPELSGDDVENIDSMIYIEDDKLALLSDGIYTVFTTSGEVLVSNFSINFEDIEDIVYFEGEVYGVGYGNCLYAINKETGDIFGEEISQEVKRSRTLAWKNDSPLQYDVDSIYKPFVHNNRFFAIAYPTNVDNYQERLIEIFPNTNEMIHISFCDISFSQISELSFTEDRSNEVGYSVDDYETFIDILDLQIYQYNGEMWVEENTFYKEPTINNLILQYGDRTAFYNLEDPGWLNATITGVSFNEENYEWVITFTGNNSNNDIMRIRYADGNGNFWAYIGED